MSESQSGQPPATPAPSADADALAQTRGADAPFALSQEPVTAQGPAPELPAGSVPAPAYEHLGELPATYGTQSVYLVAYDPHQLFAYWDIDWKSAPNALYTLHVCRADGEIETRVDISATDAGRHVDVGVPGGTYFVEMGTRGRDGSWQPVAASSRVTMPPPGVSGDLEPKFATLPFHLSFQWLIELIDHAMGRHETLTHALSRLQQGGEPEISPLLGTLNRLTGDQRHTLEMLLGQRFEIASDTSSPAGGVRGGAPQVLRDRHETLSSGAFGSESLSSGGFGSEALSSGGALSSGALAAEGSETLSSGGFGSEALASGALAPGIFGVEWLSSGAFGSEALSSLAIPGPSSEAWRLAGRIGPGGGSDTMDSERAAVFLHAVEKNLEVLGPLFSAFGSDQGGASDGFSAGGW